MKKVDAIKAIEKHGALLVFPMNNRKEPLSLWSVFYPRSEMRWEWDDAGDNRVPRLWHLRTELSTSDRVVYSKWYRGRATVFSKRVFSALLAKLWSETGDPKRSLSDTAAMLLEQLEADSPLSTKELKKRSGLRGRSNESRYERALKELWVRGLIVGYGEVDDGAFPSLAIGSTKVVFEDVWREGENIMRDEVSASQILEAKLGRESPFLKEFRKTIDSLVAPAKRRKIPSVVFNKDLF